MFDIIGKDINSMNLSLLEAALIKQKKEKKLWLGVEFFFHNHFKGCVWTLKILAESTCVYWQMNPQIIITVTAQFGSRGL